MQNDCIKNFEHIIHDISVQSTNEALIFVNKKEWYLFDTAPFLLTSLPILSLRFSADRSILPLLVARQG